MKEHFHPPSYEQTMFMHYNIVSKHTKQYMSMFTSSTNLLLAKTFEKLEIQMILEFIDWHSDNIQDEEIKQSYNTL